MYAHHCAARYPGYNLCRPETGYFPLAQAGIQSTIQPVTHQQGIKPFPADAPFIGGHLFSSFPPDELRDLPVPPRGASLKALDAGFREHSAPINGNIPWWVGCWLVGGGG